MLNSIRPDREKVTAPTSGKEGKEIFRQFTHEIKNGSENFFSP